MDYTYSGVNGLGGHEWPEFNIRQFSKYSDENGIYTNEPILLGIANHLRISGGNGGYGEDGFVGDGISGSTPFGSPNEFLSKINWSACEKYAAGKYRNIRSAVMNRKLTQPPANFVRMARSYSSKSGVPTSIIIMIGKSESGYRNCPKNSYGYGGYFGSKAGPEGSFDTQAETVRKSYEGAKRNSAGADELALAMLTYVHHHLPAVGSKYWNKTGGKIWSTDPDYIVNNVKACYPSIRPVTLAEHLMLQLAAQYMALQLRTLSF